MAEALPSIDELDVGAGPGTLAGHVFGRYRLAREIASGGMASIYLAHKAGLAGFAQLAAVKVIHPHLVRDPEFVAMFLDEARLASCINHPNVCRVLDFGKSDNTYFLAMEHLLGETWAEVLNAIAKRGSEEDKRRIAVFIAYVIAQACEGLHAAHEARDGSGRPLDIVHRDVSPQNLIVTYDGNVSVLDFGIASASERLHTTRDGSVKGRFAYMSPEQMRGDRVDRRADVWSLGVVLWEGLARKRLFKRATEAETILAVQQDALPQLRDVDVRVPDALNTIVYRALARDRDLRFASAREMGLELMRFVSVQKDPFGPAAASKWMERVFAARLERKRRMLQEAIHGERAPLDSVPPPKPPANDSQSTSTRTLAATEGSGQYMPISPAPTISEVSGPRRRVLTDAIHESMPPWLRARRTKRALGFAVAIGALLALLVDGDPESAKREQPTRPRVVADREATRAVPSAAPIVAAAEPKATAAPPTVATAKPKVASAPANVATAQPRAAITERRSRASASPKVSDGADVKGPPGMLSIATPGGWADVYVDGKKLGATPGRFSVPSGRRELKLVPFGKGPARQERVVVGAGAVTKVSITLRGR